MTDTREQILKTAIRLLNEQGFANITLNDVVKESGISKGGVYWHFKNKSEILEALYDYILNGQMQAIEAALAQPGTASDTLHRIFQPEGTQSDSDLPHSLELYALALREDSLMKRMKAFFVFCRERIAKVIQQGIDQGEFAPSDADSAAISLISFMEGIMIVGLTVLTPQEFQYQLDHALELMLQGLLKHDVR